MMRISSYVLVLGLMSLQVQAADPTVTRWSEQILTQQPERKLVEAYRAQQQAVTQSGRNLLGNTSLTLIHENDGLTGNEGINNWEAGISLPLKALRQQQAYDPLSEAYGNLAKVQKAWLAWQARGIARTLLSDYQQASALLRHAQQRYGQVQKLYALVEKEVRAGLRSQLDLALTQQQLSQAKAALAQAQAGVKTQKKRLETWGLTPSDTMPAPKAVEINTIEQQLKHHPAWQRLSAQQTLAQAQAKKGVYDAETSTEIYLGARNEQATGVPDNTRLVLSVSVPLGHTPDAQLAKSDLYLTQRESEAAAQALMRDLKLKFVQAQAQLSAAQAQLQPAQAQLAAAQQALKLSEMAWQQGEISLQQLLLAQQAYLDAQLNVAQAEAAYIRAVYQFNQAAGE